MKLIYLIPILILSLSCTERKINEKENSSANFVNPSKSDTLKFISGIRAIFQDSKGNYWIGSHNEGVSQFNGKTHKYFTTNEGLADNQIRSIQEDKNGIIWFGTASGVSSYDGKKFTNHSPITDVYSKNVRRKSENYLWFNAGNKAGVYRANGQLLNYLAFPKPKNENPYNSYGVTDVSKGKDGKVWIATYAALFNYDGKEISVFEDIKFALKDDEVLHIRSVFADSKGRIWIGNNGIGVLLHQDGSTLNFSDKKGLIHKNSSKNGKHSPTGTLEHVFVIAEDSDGNIWFGDRDTGAWKFDGTTVTNYTVDNNLSTPMVWSIYNDVNNNLLFGMADGGVYKFSGKAFDKMF